MSDQKKCWYCARENRDTYRYCLGCGSDLDADSAEQERRQEATPPPEPSQPVVKASTMQEYLRSRKVFYPWNCPQCGAENTAEQVRCSECRISRKKARSLALAAALHKPEPKPDYALGPCLLEGRGGELRVGVQTSLRRRVLVCLFRSGIDEASIHEHARALGMVTGRLAVAIDVGTRAGTTDHYLAVDLSPGANGETFAQLLAPLWSGMPEDSQLDSLAGEYRQASREFTPYQA